MATKHSLICWGGHLGKTVSISATTDLVTLTNHGLRNGKKLWPSGTLPAELSVLVPVYARWTATNTFSLHPTSADAIADTNKILFAGSSTYSAVVFKAEAIANPASYFAFAGLSDLSRWYDDDLDVYRIYGGRVSWNTARAAASTVFDTEVAELGDDFDDISGSSFSLTMNSAAVVVTSLVNGVRGNGWHGGFKGAGYVAMVPNGGITALASGNIQDVTFDGFSCTVLSTSASGAALATSSRGGNVVKNMILSGISTSFGIGISLQGAMTKLQNCLITGLLRGIAPSSYTYGALIANNTVVGNGTGVYAEGSGASTYGKWYNNAVFGNTTNWSRAAPAAVEAASHNTGESGDAIATWEVGAGATSFDITSSAFADYAGGDFRPASASSLLVDAGTDYYGRLAYDLGDNEVPNYNNGGAEGIDIGCFEFDNGYGPWPSSDARGLAFAGLVSGSKVKVFLTGTDTEKFSTASSGTSETWSESVSGSLTVDYVIMKAGYLPIRVTGVTVTAGPSGVQPVPVSQVVARWYQASSGLTINTNCFANTSTKKWGLTTTSTLQNLASYLLEQWVALGDTGEAYANKAFPLEANGPNSFTWLDGWEADLSTYAASITNLSRDGMRYLNSSGVMTASWCALLSAGVPAGLQVRFQQVEGATPTNAAATGNIDQLIQIYGDATHGSFDRRGYMVAKVQEEGYDQAEVDVVAQYGALEDQLYVIALIPTANGIAAANPTVSSVTITDHGASPVTWNTKAFSITITDSGTTSGQTIMQWIRHALDTGGTFQGKNGFNWHDLIQVNGDKFKGVRGSIYGDTGAALKGVRVLRGSDAHPDVTLHTADDGTTVSTTPPAQATATILANSRIQLYNVTTAAELDNSFQTGTTYANTLSAGVSVGDTLRLRVCKLGYESAEALAVWTANGAAFIISQAADAIYAAWGIDGSTITEFSGDVTGHIYIDANDLDGQTTKTRLGAWYSYVLTLDIGIRYFYGAVTALATNAIRINVDVADILIENVNASTALRFTDTDVRLYRSDGTSIIAPTSYSIHNDYSGVPDVVETGTSGLTTAESNKLMALPETADVWGYTLGPRSAGNQIKAIAASLVGESSGAGTTHITFTDGAVTVDADVPLPGEVGNRENVVIGV